MNEVCANEYYMSCGAVGCTLYGTWCAFKKDKPMCRNYAAKFKNKN